MAGHGSQHGMPGQGGGQRAPSAAAAGGMAGVDGAGRSGAGDAARLVLTLRRAL